MSKQTAKLVNWGIPIVEMVIGFLGQGKEGETHNDTTETQKRTNRANILLLREGCKKSKWKFKMAFAIRGPTPSKLATWFQNYLAN